VAEPEQLLAGRRDANLPADPEEQRLVELVFEQQNLTADGGLGEVEVPARAGEGASLRDGAEDLELPEVHA
jgi:hypothetical protein